MILRKTAVASASNPDCIYYMNNRNGILYEFDQKSVDNLEAEVIDATDKLTSFEQLQNESLRTMDEYIRTNNT